MKLPEPMSWNRAEAREGKFDGKFILGVMTTGIYCLPSCAARPPKAQNVRLFTTEIEAKAAGLRACSTSHSIPRPPCRAIIGASSGNRYRTSRPVKTANTHSNSGYRQKNAASSQRRALIPAGCRARFLSAAATG